MKNDLEKFLAGLGDRTVPAYYTGFKPAARVLYAHLESGRPVATLLLADGSATRVELDLDRIMDGYGRRLWTR